MTSGNGIPTTGDLELGELAINTYMGTMYTKATVGSGGHIVEISANTIEGSTDYTAGTWTPTITAASASGVTYSLQEGYYIKMGDLVTCNFRLLLTDTGTTYGALAIAGLPYTAGASPTLQQCSITCGTVDVSDDQQVAGLLANGGTTIGLYKQNPDSALAVLSSSGATYIQDTSEFVGSITYRTV
jgi:hypothetical protein